MAKKKKILDDHKLIKKKLLPPLFHLLPGWETQFMETPYLYKVLPEIIWQGFLNDKWGVSVTSRITYKLLEEIERARNFEKGKLFCFISNFELLTSKQLDFIIGRLFLDSDFKKIIEGLSSFIRVFPECPLKVLFHTSIAEPTNKDVEYVKRVLTLLLNKLSKEATFMLANTVYYAFQMDVLKVTEGSTLLELPKVQFYPDTEESKMIASYLRATINPFVQGPFIQVSNKWQNYFWNQAYKYEPFNIDNLYFE